MANIGKITVDININISKETAKQCLKIVEWYCNQNKCTIIGKRQKDYTTEFEIIDELL